jgi:hypothetical protein
MFKYMTDAVAPHFLRTLKVRFTKPSDLNDPFELRPMLDVKGTSREMRAMLDLEFGRRYGTVDDIFKLMEEVQASDPEFPKLPASLPDLRKIIADNPALEKQLMEELQKHAANALDSLTKSPEWEYRWEALWKEMHERFGQYLGILSLTEDPTNTVMWSHYASQHYGIVVEFDETHPWFNQKLTPVDDLRHLVQVSYVCNPRPRTWTQTTGIDVLYTKDASWSYEREWRLIRPLKDAIEVSPGVFCIDVPAEVVCSVTLGCRIRSSLEQEVRDLVSRNSALAHVAITRIRLLGDRQLDIVETKA